MASKCDATIIYEYLTWTLHDFRQFIQDSPYLSVYERVIVYKIVQALRYLAHLDIIHKDIKDKNVMLNLKNGLTPVTTFSSEDDAYEQLLENLQVKLIDFGLSLDRSSEQFGQGGGKTREYESPENIIKLPKTSKSFDMWSLGILLLEWYLEVSFFLRKYSHINLYFIHFYIETIDPIDWPAWKTGRFWDRHAANLEKTFKEFSEKDQAILEELHEKWLLAFKRMDDSWTRHFVLSLLRVRPSNRLTADQALQHPYFNPIQQLKSPPYSQALADYLENQFGDFSFSEADDGEQEDKEQLKSDSTKNEPNFLLAEQDQVQEDPQIPAAVDLSQDHSVLPKPRGSKSEL
jgi:serine/threonine protein kinase